MKRKMGDKIAFWLACICTEIVLYAVILVGVSIMCYGAFKTIRFFPAVIAATMIEILCIWRKYMQGTYAKFYREYVLKEGVS